MVYGGEGAGREGKKMGRKKGDIRKEEEGETKEGKAREEGRGNGEKRRTLAMQ